jgi:type I restriction enzyme R subunit
MPFYDVVLMIAFDGKPGDDKVTQKIAGLVEEIVEELQKTIDVINFWKKLPRVRKLEGIIEDILSFSGIDEVVATYKRITTEILNLARKRHDDLVRNKPND